MVKLLWESNDDDKLTSREFKFYAKAATISASSAVLANAYIHPVASAVCAGLAVASTILSVRELLHVVFENLVAYSDTNYGAIQDLREALPPAQKANTEVRSKTWVLGR